MMRAGNILGWAISGRLTKTLWLVVGIIVFACAGRVIWQVMCMFEGEKVYSYYRTFKDAETDGAIKRGWMPSIVPRDAVIIHELHDIDTNQEWISFYASADSLAKMIARLTRDEPVLRPGSDIDKSWSKQLAIYDPIRTARIYEMYVILDGPSREVVKGHVAVDRSGNRAYYWVR